MKLKRWEDPRLMAKNGAALLPLFWLLEVQKNITLWYAYDGNAAGTFKFF